MKYPEDFINKLICTDCQEGMRDIPTGSIDLMVTDPPYGYAFMQRNWDKALVNIDAWQECLRVLKPGAFAFIMCAPRQDVLSRQIINLEEAGFITGFSSIYWAYASGFPKASNIGKMVDKKLGVERENGIKVPRHYPDQQHWGKPTSRNKVAPFTPGGKYEGELEIATREITIPATTEAKTLNGSYGGFQPKPAVEVIIVVMKPLSEKTYMEQALKDGKGITWLDEGRIPYKGSNDFDVGHHNKQLSENVKYKKTCFGSTFGYGLLNSNIKKGRFPANLLVSDNVLNDGKILISPKHINYGNRKVNQWTKKPISDCRTEPADSGSFSRYFDLDKWWEERVKQLPESVQKTFPFLIVPKASKAEKNKGCERLEEKVRTNINKMMGEAGNFKTGSGNVRTVKFKNHHPTVKPIKLMSYLIILGSRPNDIILDPFVGSGTTCIAAKMLGRKHIGFDNDKGYVEIAQCRLGAIEAVLI